MLDEATIQRVGKHEMLHTMGMCTCPCFDALLTVSAALKTENELRARLAEISPDVLAALTIASVESDE